MKTTNRSKKFQGILPILPLFENRVLLPGAFARQKSTQYESTLIEYLLRRRSSPGLVVDVVAVPTPTLENDPDHPHHHHPLSLDQIHSIGTAARIIELVRNPSTSSTSTTNGTATDDHSWVIVLEGRCRVSVSNPTYLGPQQQQDQQSVYVAKVKQLDYFDPGLHARDPPLALPLNHNNNTHGTMNTTNEMASLQADVLNSIRILFSAAALSSSAGTRTLSVLHSYGPALTADLVGSFVVTSHAHRMTLLNTLDVVKRLQLVKEVLNSRLAAAGLLTNANSTSPGNTYTTATGSPVFLPTGVAPYSIRTSNSTSSTTLRHRPSSHNQNHSQHRDGGEGDGNADADAEANEAQVLLKKIKAGNPGHEVVAAATKECQRVQRMNEQHPGYAAAIGYLEILADLPWSRSSSSLNIGIDTNKDTLSSTSSSSYYRLAAVRRQLDEDHFGLDKVKERIVQFVAVQSLRGWGARAPVLCLIGPPGVGKTSIARSMATALKRPFQRISLGGVRDEAEVRGHRRTYVGALPGRIITALRRAGTNDAVVLLDEIDKTGRDARGDPAAALLEVLDPEQNGAFVDAYVAVPVDLSKIIFICTANTVADIPPPLLDRMEVVNLGAYTVEEKVTIAQQHLVPRCLSEHGMTKDQVVWPEMAVRELIEGYTREAGVRQLSQRLAAMCRYVAVRLVAEREEQQQQQYYQQDIVDGSSSARTRGGREAKDEQSSKIDFLGPGSMGLVVDPVSSSLATSSHATDGVFNNRSNNNATAPLPPHPPPAPPPLALALPIVVDLQLIEQVLGQKRYRGHDTSHRVSSPGAAAGLVWTAAGGAVQYIECLMIGSRDQQGQQGEGSLTLTGQLGDVLEESARIALSWVRAHQRELEEAVSGGNGGPIAIANDMASSRSRSSWDIHIHLPAGAVPKDGPSAGVTLAVALVSLFTGRCVRADVALTGELTLRGLVLPVGGVKEKVLAAVAAGMQRVIIPAGNVKDVEVEVPEEVRAGLEVVGVERVEQALAAAFDPPIMLVNGVAVRIGMGGKGDAQDEGVPSHSRL